MPLDVLDTLMGDVCLGYYLDCSKRPLCLTGSRDKRDS